MSIAPNAARVYLPKLQNPPATILEYLCHHFPQVAEEVWRARVNAGKVSTNDAKIHCDTAYQHGITVAYFRELEVEEKIPFQEDIIFENDHLLIADKPHFLPVTPAGQSVNECLLYRLQMRTGISELAPLHRLDRDTAGLVLFSKVKAERRLYARLFAAHEVERTYMATAAMAGKTIPQEGDEWTVENRLAPGDPWFRMKVVAEASVNATTHIRFKKVGDGFGLFELHPQTGKKHQLRVHMMSIGFPIVNDCFYPEVGFRDPGDYSNPLQLLASQIRFIDPIIGEPFLFKSNRALAGWQEQT